jgi:hypothetical protein
MSLNESIVEEAALTRLRELDQCGVNRSRRNESLIRH